MSSNAPNSLYIDNDLDFDVHSLKRALEEIDEMDKVGINFFE